MRAGTTIGWLLALIGTLWPLPALLLDPEPALSAGPVFIGASPSEQALIEEVFGEFERHDLALPDGIEVVFSDVKSDCNGFDGLYKYKRAKVVFCREPDRDRRFLRKLARHELGHAWDDHNMTEARRARFTARIGRSGKWLDANLAHDDRPGERFANTVAGVVQGLIDREQFDEMIGLR